MTTNVSPVWVMVIILLLIVCVSNALTMHALYRTTDLARLDVVPIEHGGTSATTLASARSNFGFTSVSKEDLNVLPEHMGGTGFTSTQGLKDFMRPSLADMITQLDPLSEEDVTVTTRGSGRVRAIAGTTFVSPNSLVTKEYASNFAAGLRVLTPVVARASAALAATYDNGANGVGATLTASANGALTCGGVAFAPGDEGARVLVDSQAAATENGVYTVTAVGDGASPWVLTRAADMDGSPSYEIISGMTVFVSNGDWANTRYALVVSKDELSYPNVSLATGAQDDLVFVRVQSTPSEVALAGHAGSIQSVPAVDFASMLYGDNSNWISQIEGVIIVEDLDGTTAPGQAVYSFSNNIEVSGNLPSFIHATTHYPMVPATVSSSRMVYSVLHLRSETYQSQTEIWWNSGYNWSSNFNGPTEITSTNIDYIAPDNQISTPLLTYNSQVWRMRVASWFMY